MFELILIFLSCVVLIPVLVLSFQVLLASLPVAEKEEVVSMEDVRFIVLVPAHDEEPVLAETLKTLCAQLGPGGSILLVADNCTDNTAHIARQSAVEVIERRNPDKLGKGYALSFGIEHIRNLDNPPDVVVVVDADCNVREGDLLKLVNKCSRVGRPIQALYLMHSSSSESSNPARKIAEFAWLVKNQVRPSGYSRLGLPCQLTGTGMAFPLRLLLETNLAGSNIVEDMKLGIDMALAGYSPQLYPEACVVSFFPEEASSVISQRTRWEHGHLGIIVTESAGLLGSAIKRKDLHLLAMALDLMVPPLAFLAVVQFLMLLLVFFTNLSGLADRSPLWIMCLSCGLFTASILLAWGRFARHILGLKDLIAIPAYVMRKIPMYIRFWAKRQKDWVRTGRD